MIETDLKLRQKRHFKFTMGGPSVRVTANDRVEFKWSTDAAWVGAVEVFDNPERHWTFDRREGNRRRGWKPDRCGPARRDLRPDTATNGYFFKVTNTDLTGSTMKPNGQQVFDVDWIKVSVDGCAE